VTKAALGGRAIWRAVTCVKSEQASKVKMWTPTRLNYGEGRVGWGSNRCAHPFRSTGVIGTARRKGVSGNRGIPVRGGGSVFNVACGGGPGRESDRVTVPLRLGNAGGGKDPDFWCAFDEDEDR
jgi:hypothetical protein